METKINIIGKTDIIEYMEYEKNISILEDLTYIYEMKAADLIDKKTDRLSYNTCERSVSIILVGWST